MRRSQPSLSGRVSSLSSVKTSLPSKSPHPPLTFLNQIHISTGRAPRELDGLSKHIPLPPRFSPQRLNSIPRKFSTEFLQFSGSHSNASVGVSGSSAGWNFSFLLFAAVWRAATSSFPCSVSPTALAHLPAAVRAEQLSPCTARDKRRPGRSGHSRSNKAERSDQSPSERSPKLGTMV